jgi:hypothetical protein
VALVEFKCFCVGSLNVELDGLDVLVLRAYFENKFEKSFTCMLKLVMVQQLKFGTG